MASGIQVSPDCMNVFQEMKMKKCIPFVIFKILDKKEIVIDYCGKPAGTNDQGEQCGDNFDTLKSKLLAALSENDCRYVLYDVPVNGDEKNKKMAFLSWCPDEAKVGHRMLYASSKDYLKKAFSIIKDVHMSDTDDLNMDYISKHV